MTNSSLRERFGIEGKNSAIASRIIRDTIEDGLVRPYDPDQGKKYAKYSWGNGDKDYEKGFGRQVLGETWVSHWGNHDSQSTRGLIAKGQEQHPILRGIKDGDIWGPTDVYEAHPGGDSVPLVMGQNLAGMKFDDPPAKYEAGKQNRNEPMMPVAWTKTYQGASGKTARIFCTTLGAATDLEAEGTRRMLVNGRR